MSDPTLRELAQAHYPHGRPVATFWQRRGIYYDRQDPDQSGAGHMGWTEAVARGMSVANGYDGLMEALSEVDRAAAHRQTRAMIAALYWRAGRLHMQAQARRGTPYYDLYKGEYEGVRAAAWAMERHL